MERRVIVVEGPLAFGIRRFQAARANDVGLEILTLPLLAARLAGGTMTLREFWGRRGHDYRDVLKQLAEEKALLETWGLTFGDVVKRTVSVSQDTDDAERGETVNAA
ncbi:MAG: hypothetical protein J0H57_19575 [Rhodospirillales bacterium]|nr:hypothetical protein [Rhodospirillales bacterium]